MHNYLDINNINISIGGILLALSMVMFMIPIPRAVRWRNFRTGRNTLAAAYVVLGALMVVNGAIGDDNSGPSGMITLTVAFFQALLYTRICVLFLKPRSFDGMHYRLLLAAFALFSIALAISYFADPEIFIWLFYVGIGLYTILLIYCSFIFSKNYRETLKHLEYIYDEDMYYRLRWVKSCFYSALLVGVMAWFMAVFHNSDTLNILGIFIYTIYYLCMVGYYMRYVSDYGFILKSDVETTESRPLQPDEPATRIPRKETRGKDGQARIKDESKLEERLESWVRQKKYRDSSKTMDDIVQELGTTRANLNEYMNNRHGMNFRTWRNRLRIEEAKRLLTDSEIPVADIHYAVGYTDRSNFHRQFTETVGETPMHYRNRNKS